MIQDFDVISDRIYVPTYHVAKEHIFRHKTKNLYFPNGSALRVEGIDRKATIESVFEILVNYIVDNKATHCETTAGDAGFRSPKRVYIVCSTEDIDMIKEAVLKAFGRINQLLPTITNSLCYNEERAKATDYAALLSVSGFTIEFLAYDEGGLDTGIFKTYLDVNEEHIVEEPNTIAFFPFIGDIYTPSDKYNSFHEMIGDKIHKDFGSSLTVVGTCLTDPAYQDVVDNTEELYEFRYVPPAKNTIRFDRAFSRRANMIGFRPGSVIRVVGANVCGLETVTKIIPKDIDFLVAAKERVLEGARIEECPAIRTYTASPTKADQIYRTPLRYAVKSIKELKEAGVNIKMLICEEESAFGIETEVLNEIKELGCCLVLVSTCATYSSANVGKLSGKELMARIADREYNLPILPDALNGVLDYTLLWRTGVDWDRVYSLFIEHSPERPGQDRWFVEQFRFRSDSQYEGPIHEVSRFMKRLMNIKSDTFIANEERKKTTGVISSMLQHDKGFFFQKHPDVNIALSRIMQDMQYHYESNKKTHDVSCLVLADEWNLFNIQPKVTNLLSLGWPTRGNKTDDQYLESALKHLKEQLPQYSDTVGVRMVYIHSNTFGVDQDHFNKKVASLLEKYIPNALLFTFYTGN